MQVCAACDVRRVAAIATVASAPKTQHLPPNCVPQWWAPWGVVERASMPRAGDIVWALPGCTVRAEEDGTAQRLHT